MSDINSGNPESEQKAYDIIIIGGGPAGLTAALYGARAGLSILVLDKNQAAGALGSADRIANYPGIPGAIKGTELLSIIRGQAESFGAKVLQEQVFGVDLTASPRQVITSGSTYPGRAIIIATGSMGRQATLRGEAEFTGRGVSYCATCDAAFYKNRDVAVYGKLAEIVEEVDTLARFARTIHVITREKTIPEDFTAGHDRPRSVVMHPGSHIDEIHGDTAVRSITVINPGGEKQEMEVDGVFLFLHGTMPVTDYLYGAVETTQQGCIKVDAGMATSVEGVYAVGDVTCRKVRQVVLAAAEGCLAALSAEQYLGRRARPSSQWSH